MEFRTERLLLRPFMSDDLQDVFNIYKDEETCRYLLHDKWTEENIEENFDKKLKNNSFTKETMLSLAVVIDTKVIGDLSVWYTNMKDTVEIGYCFASEVSGKGYATEAVSSLVRWLFNEFQVHRIQATLDARNKSSQKLCERIGMRKEAHFKKDFWNKGEWTDSMVYGMLFSDLEVNN
ncbi:MULTISPECIES: GNAT family N-acetyltransferase [unclassified Mesobacillus]|uniref:GNAT family N-acetyltransferase n=1 Tax=unclassified Mesobacillus TaxID=2675270 RepID=UPI00203D1623|nr:MULTISPECIES: GNAT family N-acetyltransferase [unclassified Mesobacillus]MCM3122802.1 GNAT family N-acetyltransferase [Mesobacillus sp. MER 33]MCM3233715.1 GNAT family N-acetyltransferase [Mesobacillus sp. MER 48]